ncbi:MAG: flagellar filament capping protein FliD [Candidatus Scalindua sp.]|nr:flagellar filament capping protein FliD [Candidatus Scalindua sp.]
MLGTSSIGGLVSGLDTKGLISQLMAVSSRRVQVVVGNQEKQNDKLAAFQALNTSLSEFKAKAEALNNTDTFNVYKGNTTTTSTNFKADDLLTVSTTTDASPGNHTIEFTATSQLATARKLSSQSFSSKTAALEKSGAFVINGSGISITTSDSLTEIATKINNANSGSNATGVTASVLTVSSTDHRLIIKSDETGAGKFSLLDATSSGDILQDLGLSNTSSAIKTVTSDGAQSDEFSNSEASVRSLLGISGVHSGTVTIGGVAVTIDLENDSLTEIASNISDTVAGVSASVVSTTADGVTKYRIDISGTTAFTDDNNVLQALGILEGQQGIVAEVHTASQNNTETSAGTGTSITSGTAFALINTGSDSNNVTNGDTITITGTKNDGSAATGTYTISDKSTDTIQGFLTEIETVFGLDAGSATMSNGKVLITDSVSGDSQLSVTISTNNEGGGTLDFGTLTATTQGYSMETTAGQDAKVKIDGVIVSRSTNTIDDVISGVTLNLSQVESGTAVNLTISRDTDSIKSSVNDFLKAYNTIIESINREFKFDEEKESAGVLSGESTLVTIKSIIQSTITNTISLLPSGSNALSLIGINSDKNGKLSLTDSTFISKINSGFNAVKRMFIAEGTTTNSEVTYISHTNKTVAGGYAVVIDTVSTQAAVTGTEDLSSGIGGSTDTITITDTATGRVATINLDGNGGGNATSLTDIVNTINSELAAERAQVLVGSVANTAAASNITGGTAFSDIDGTSLQDGDVISFTGTSKAGKSINDSFTISGTDTVQDFLSAIESAYDNTVSATINAGKIKLADITGGDSLLSITISEPSGRGLDFGTVSETNTDGVTGRYAMELTASSSGNNFVLTHNSYGSAQGFTIDESNDTLGAEGSQIGVDVAGTINGESATGVGQILTGDAPAADSTTSVEGLVLRILSTAATTPSLPSSKGTVTLTKGAAEQMFNNIDTIVNSIDGLLTIRMDGLQESIDSLQGTIDGMEDRLSTEQANLEFKFVRLELNLSRLQSVSSFLSQQLGSLSRLTR